MALIASYNTFKSHLPSGVTVTFAEYRERLHPLRAKRTLTETERGTIAEYVRRGVGPAFAMFSEAAARAAAECAEQERERENQRLRADALLARIEDLVQHCKADGWTPSTFKALVVHLDEGRAVPGGSLGESDVDVLGTVYRQASPDVQGRIRQRLQKEAL